MKRKNLTRNALFSSIIALLLCVSMLVGTTFAWFTDEVTTGMNTIAAGNLDVELYANGNQVDGSTKLFDDVTLWEPGVVVYENLQVKNVGTLALKYQMSLNFGSENHLDGHKLSEVLKVAIVDKIADNASRADVLAAAKAANPSTLADFVVNGELAAKTDADVQTVVIFWEPKSNEIDNLYNANNGKATSDGEKLHIEFGVNLFATQKMSEEDSFDNTYDKNAWHNAMLVATAADLKAALGNGASSIMLVNDIALDESVVIPEGKTVAINLNGKSITNEAAYDDVNYLASSAVVNNGTLTLTGNGSIKASNNYTVRNYGTMNIDGITIENGVMNFADLTVESGNISNSRSGKHTIYGKNAKLTINGGEFYNGNPGNATIFSDSGEVAINGGAFSIADGTATLGWTSCLLDAKAGAKFTINGGVINGVIRDYGNNTLIYGGVFSVKPNAAFVSAGHYIYEKNGQYYVLSENTVNNVAALANRMAATTADVCLFDCNEPNGAVVIPAAYTGTVTLKDSTIKSVAAVGTANIKVEGNVVVNNTEGSAITGKVLNITGNGALTAIANGNHAYGIGGDATEKITITDLHIVNVKGGHAGAVGSDTKYYKDAPEGGAAIGSGVNGAVITLDNVKIEKAIGGAKAAGIGALYHTGVIVNITDSTIGYVEGGVTAAAIGSSRVSSGAAENGTTINIKNSTITAMGGAYGAGIGSGYDTHCLSAQPLCTINIDGSTINATGGKYAAGVGSGYHNAALAGEIKNSTVNAVSGEKLYKDTYTLAQDIGFGVVDPAREGQQSSKLIYNGTEIGIPPVA